MIGVKKSVLIFASGQLDKIGGIQRSYQILTDYLIRKGWKVELYGFAATLSKIPDPQQLACPLHRKVKVEIIKDRVEKKVFDDLVCKVKTKNPSLIVIINSSPKAVFYAAVAQASGISFIYSMRGSTEYCLRYLWPCRAVFDLIFQTADAVHLLMPSYFNLLPVNIKDRLEIIPSQIEPAKKLAKPDFPDDTGRFKIVYSGRFSFEKQLHYLIQAFSRIASKFPEWDLVMVGDGPLGEGLKKLAEDERLGARVEWLSVDNTEAMYQLYPKMHIKVLPSEYEGCPMALREAMAHGLPVIAFETCTGSNEIIQSGYDGILAQSENPVQGLADSMSSLILHPSERVRLGQNAIRKAEQYMPDPINKRWENMMLKVIKDKANNKGSINPEAERMVIDLASKGMFGKAYIFNKDNELYERYKREYLTIYGRRLFDIKYYLQTYVDVKSEGCDPLLHYISTGWRKGYNPSPEFDTNLYLELYLDSVDNDLCPLYHYYIVGAYKGCFPPAVDTDYYEKWPARRPKISYSIIEDIKSDPVLAEYEALKIL